MKNQTGATKNTAKTSKADGVLSYLAWLSISSGAGYLLWNVAGLQGAFN